MNTKQTFTVDDKKVTVYPAALPDRPIVYLNTFQEDNGGIYKALQNAGCPAFTLVVISGLAWDDDMTPWAIPPISPGDTPCSGGADKYLRLFTDEIMPRAEEFAPGHILWRGLAGYSLAGLFALYAVYRTAFFSRIASISGSLWFPGFKEYVFTHEMPMRPACLYLSLGNQERKTRNPYLKIVQECTEEIAAFYKQNNIDTVFQLNPGNHYKNFIQRTAAGIAWILSR